jgi:hypothetical protein
MFERKTAQFVKYGMIFIGSLILVETLMSCIHDEPKTIRVIKEIEVIKTIEVEKTIDLDNWNEVVSDPNSIIAFAASKLKDPYVWGGSYKWNKYDCSSLVQGAFAQAGIKLPRTANEQSKKGMKVKYSEIKKGDVMFFLTNKKRGLPVTHVSIYIGDGKMIHAKGKKYGIVVDYISKYKKRFVIAKRFL